MTVQRTIRIESSAPPKPEVGAACNGCGVCCALETCPPARLRFLRARGPCPALEWSAKENRYHCGLLVRPAHYLPFLTTRAEAWARRLVARSIAASQGCDCNAEAGD